ncbi:hypothetical protein B0H13DRAFT_2357044 [Mycena leptocephala]|nr:hypothetical protein B0H13DRAFT_2357044 [Mycena leptocephala]
MLPKSFDSVDKILQYTAVAADALQDVADRTRIPFLDSVCTLTLTIIPVVQMESGVKTANALAEFSIDTDGRHQELLELISSQSGSIDNVSSIRSSLNTSSGSLSLLPASPKIFHGRESELKDLIDSLLCDAARAAILGPGGMGKTTLAMSALHHPAIMEKYGLRHFISCESATTCGDLVANIGLYLGLESSPLLSKAIVRHFGQCGTCLVILDNFETPWEPIESRAQVEEFLSLLADIPSLTLLLTMRGAERPGKIKWNRPFLPSLEPLSVSASRQIFLEIADEPGSGEESALDDLLDLSGSLPLAVSLMANIASFEGYSSTLARWEMEKIALLSEGHDKRSNLEKSITLSLNSPRISSSPHAKNLISLLSLLPDGIKPEDIIAGKVPIPNVRQCQSLLVGTSLAYIDVKGRLKTLSPVRECIRQVYPPSLSLSRPLRTYFQDLLEVWRSRHQLPSPNLAPELVGYLGNINQLFLEGLMTEEKSAWIAIGESIIALDVFSRVMLKGGSLLLQRLPRLIEATGDAGLRWRYETTIIKNYRHLIQDPDALIKEGVQHFNERTRPARQAVAFYNAVSTHYNTGKYMNVYKATEFNKRAFALAQQASDIDLQLVSLEIEQNIAFRCHDPYWTIEVARKARDIAGVIWSNPWQHPWIQLEATANHWRGNLCHALDLCSQAEEQLTSIGMEDSSQYLLTLDIHATVLVGKSEYSEARRLFSKIVEKTSPTCSPWYHAHALCWIAEMDILMEGGVADIVSNLNAAEAVYVALGSRTITLCSWVAAELRLHQQDTENARAMLLECLSKGRGIYLDITDDSLAALADPASRMHGTLDTFRWAVVYLAFVQNKKNAVGTLHALRRLADIHMDMDDEETALHLFHTVLDAGTKMDIHRLRAQCMVGIGDIMLRRGHPMETQKMWGAAQLLFIRSSRMKDAAAVEKWLEQLSHTRQDNSCSLAPFCDGTVNFTNSDSESSLTRLQTVLAPTTSPSMQVKATPDPGSSTNRHTKLSVL